MQRWLGRSSTHLWRFEGLPPALSARVDGCSLQPSLAWEGRGETEKGLTSNYLQWFIAAMKGFPQMNRLNIFFERNAVRLLGVFFFVSLLTLRHFAAGETVRFAGDSESKFQYCLPV